MLMLLFSVRVVGNANSANYTFIYAESDKYITMTNKSIRDYINLIENLQREGVAEGSEEGNLYAIAIQRYPQLKRVDRETVINALNSSYEDYLMHYGYEGIGPDEESSMIDHAVKGLKQGVAEDQLEETSPDALAKIDELTRR